MSMIYDEGDWGRAADFPYTEDPNWDQIERDFDEDMLKEMQNDHLQAFLNNWQADSEDASDAAVYAALMAADLREWAGASVEHG